MTVTGEITSGELDPIAVALDQEAAKERALIELCWRPESQESELGFGTHGGEIREIHRHKPTRYHTRTDVGWKVDPFDLMVLRDGPRAVQVEYCPIVTDAIESSFAQFTSEPAVQSIFGAERHRRLKSVRLFGSSCSRAERVQARHACDRRSESRYRP